jgi:hypothetical protein
MWGTKPTNLLLPLAHSFAAHSKDSLRTEHMHRQRLLTSSYSYSTPARKPDARHALASLRLPGAPVHAGASAQGSGAGACMGPRQCEEPADSCRGGPIQGL